MAPSLFRVRLPGGESRLARGDTNGPAELLGAGLTVDDLLSGRASEFGAKVASEPRAGPVPLDTSLLAPIGSQEVWGAGVTYLRSRDARKEEALDGSPYDRVYEATRPEIFFKSVAWRVRGPAEPIAIRADSAWNVPEPELTLVLAADLGVAGYTLGNDVSSRSIEGENLLYLSQAKTYDGSCALGPSIVPAQEAEPPFDLRDPTLRPDRVGRNDLDRQYAPFVRGAGLVPGPGPHIPGRGLPADRHGAGAGGFVHAGTRRCGSDHVAADRHSRERGRGIGRCRHGGGTSEEIGASSGPPESGDNGWPTG
jgi:2-dehydro-3-deoxy-D-arabinonate dehydratase